MLRLFAALPVPEEIRTRLTCLQTQLRGAHWRPPENFHITLRFFGEVPDRQAHELDLALAEIKLPPLMVKLEGVDWFGRRRPRSVWARVKGDPELSQLSSTCEQAARKIGLPPETRTFTPHITLAYLSHTLLQDVMVWCRDRQTFDAGPMTLDRFHLVSSRLGKGPSRYTSEAEYPLDAER